MKKKNALILDLDNTIYPVKSIGDRLFAPLFEIMEEHRSELSERDYDNAVADIMRKPFQKVAETYRFGRELTEKGLNLLRHLTYEDEMTAYSDYEYIKRLNLPSFLVTTGFLKLQQSKVKRLGIENDFKEIIIVDPDKTDKTKKDVFEEIIEKYGLTKEEILVIGDDPESEIEAAQALGIETFLYDPEDKYEAGAADYKERSFKELFELLR